MATKRVFELDDGGARLRFYTFEWVCKKENCNDQGHLHRKRVKARGPHEAWEGAKSMGIPPDAKLIEEETESFLRRILW
jgi:hypothetical protein